LTISNEKERLIREDELKRFKLNDTMTKLISNASKESSKYVILREPFERLVKMKPNTIDIGITSKIPFFIKDYFEKWPSFTAVLYCDLDYQILILFILTFSLFDRVSGSSIISIGVIYIIEKLLASLR